MNSFFYEETNLLAYSNVIKASPELSSSIVYLKKIKGDGQCNEQQLW